MRRLLLLLAATLLFAGPALAAPRVVASVVPVQSIVAAVMGGTGTPELLLQGSMSEHRAVFTPAQIAALGEADLVFIVGHGLESKLAQLSGSEAVNGKRFAIGDKVRARTMNPHGHTRLPRYARGRAGEIVAVHGTHVFPDSAAHGLGEDPQWLYTVRFSARELWGKDTPDAVCIDLWEPYLEAIA